MPRVARSLVDNGYYHVVTRGIDRRKLFRYKQDYAFFREITVKYLREYHVEILHYCLMPNHIHLLIKAVVADDLSRFMQVLLQVYAARFRSRYKSVGFIFQNRYKSRFIHSDTYLLECARYIERNPLRAKIVQEAGEYSWSSFRYYANGLRDAVISYRNPLFLNMAHTEIARQEAYCKFVTQERPYDAIVDKEFKIG